MESPTESLFLYRHVAIHNTASSRRALWDNTFRPAPRRFHQGRAQAFLVGFFVLREQPALDKFLSKSPGTKAEAQRVPDLSRARYSRWCRRWRSAAELGAQAGINSGRHLFGGALQRPLDQPTIEAQREMA